MKGKEKINEVAGMTCVLLAGEKRSNPNKSVNQNIRQ